MIAPDGDFAICVGVIILQVLHLALPHGHVSPSGSLLRVSGLRLLGLLYAMIGLSVKMSLRSLIDWPVFVKAGTINRIID